MNFWFSAASGAVVMAMVAFGLHSISINYLEAQHEKALTAQAAKISGQCATAKATTEKVSNGLQNNLSTLDLDVISLTERVQKCTQHVSTGMVATTTSGYDGAAPAGKSDKGIGEAFAPRRVIQIVRKGEKYRVQLVACQSWAREVQKAAASNSK